MPERPTISHTGPLPAVLGLSLGPGGGGPHGLFAADGALVALAEPTGHGWWWLTVGDEQAMARLVPPQALLVGLGGGEVARCDLPVEPGQGPSVLRQGDRRWEIAVSGGEASPAGDRWRARVWDRGATALRLERAGDVVVVRADGDLHPTVAVFVTVALVRRSLPVAAGLGADRPARPGELPTLALEALAALLPGPRP